jgi:hypothetical protein
MVPLTQVATMKCQAFPILLRAEEEVIEKREDPFPIWNTTLLSLLPEP